MNDLLRFLLFLSFLFFSPSAALSQLVLTKAVVLDSALKNNPGIVSSMKEIQRQQALRKSTFTDRTEVWLEAPTATRFAVGVQQSFSFPTLYFNELKLQKENVRLAEMGSGISKNSLGKNVEATYLEVQYTLGKIDQLRYQDSLFEKLFRATEKRYSVGEVEYLEKVLEETKYNEVHNLLMQAEKELESHKEQLLLLARIALPDYQVEALGKYDIGTYTREDTSFVSANPLIGYYRHNTVVSKRFLKVQRANLLPGLFVGYLNQGEPGSELLYRFRVGITVPLWFPAYTSRIKAARIGMDIADYQYQAAVNSVKIEYYKAYSGLEKSRLNLEYYENRALKQADEIIRTSTRLYELGEISYFNHLNGLSQAMEIKMRYLAALRDYNMAVVNLKYLRGE